MLHTELKYVVCYYNNIKPINYSLMFATKIQKNAIVGSRGRCSVNKISREGLEYSKKER